MNAFGKTFVTLVIWIIVASVVMTALLTGSTEIVPVAIAAFIAAGFSTGVIYGNDENKKENKAESRLEQGNSGKLKRGDVSHIDAKMRLLMEMMDEDERLAFKETLKQKVLSDARINADGELNYDADTLAALLEDEERYSRR